MSGRMNEAAQLFLSPEEAGEFEREELINKVNPANLVRFGVRGNAVVMELKDGRMIAEWGIISGCPIVEFDWYPKDQWVRKHFWFNASSVSHIGQMLRESEEKRANFDSVFLGTK